MAVVTSTKIEAVSKATDTKQAIQYAAGDISGVDVLFNQILVGTYVRPERSKGGVFLTQTTLKEDEFQGKVGLVLKVGPSAFQETDDISFYGQVVKPGDWVVYRVGDGWQLQINGYPCRLLTDMTIRLKIADPSIVF